MYSVLKRLGDLVISLSLLLLLSPLMLLTAAAVKLDSPGTALFRQLRVGKDGKLFWIYKFRTMTDGDGDTCWVNDTSRVTPLGKLLRNNFIDELPQLFNVIKGDMSLVGPRPERPFFAEIFSSQFPEYPLRHSVTPGVTGWAQINGWRGDTSIKERLECDLFYIRNRSIALDLKILFSTLFIKFPKK